MLHPGREALSFFVSIDVKNIIVKLQLQRFLRKLKQKKNFFNKIEYDKLYPSGSARACIYGTPKMHKFSSSDSFPRLCRIVSSLGTCNYNLVRFL